MTRILLAEDDAAIALALQGRPPARRVRGRARLHRRRGPRAHRVEHVRPRPARCDVARTRWLQGLRRRAAAWPPGANPVRDRAQPRGRARPRFRLGADDYIVKPFSSLELRARVDAVLRRTRGVRGAQCVASRTARSTSSAREMRRGEAWCRARRRAEGAGRPGDAKVACSRGGRRHPRPIARTFSPAAGDIDVLALRKKNRSRSIAPKCLPPRHGTPLALLSGTFGAHALISAGTRARRSIRWQKAPTGAAWEMADAAHRSQTSDAAAPGDGASARVWCRARTWRVLDKRDAGGTTLWRLVRAGGSPPPDRIAAGRSLGSANGQARSVAAHVDPRCHRAPALACAGLVARNRNDAAGCRTAVAVRTVDDDPVRAPSTRAAGRRGRHGQDDTGRRCCCTRSTRASPMPRRW